LKPKRTPLEWVTLPTIVGEAGLEMSITARVLENILAT